MTALLRDHVAVRGSTSNLVYCRSGIAEAKRETMTQLAVIRHSKPRSANAKARLSEVMSKHAVEISWWSPAKLPEWLNKELYMKEIQPVLKRVRIKVISAALGVCASYAAQIRSGKLRPHPRHWQALASLAGISPPAN